MGRGRELYDSMEMMAKSVGRNAGRGKYITPGHGLGGRRRTEVRCVKGQRHSGKLTTRCWIPCTLCIRQMEIMIPHIQTVKDFIGDMRDSMGDIVDTHAWRNAGPVAKAEYARLRNIGSRTESVSDHIPELMDLMKVCVDARLQASSRFITPQMGNAVRTIFI